MAGFYTGHPIPSLEDPLLSELQNDYGIEQAQVLHEHGSSLLQE
jgi:hypothetical protein